MTAQEDNRRAVCRVCGSIRTRVVRRWFGARLVAAVRGRTFVKCERCGWQGNVPLAYDGRAHIQPSVAAGRPEKPLTTLDRADRAVPTEPENAPIHLDDATPARAGHKDVPLTALDRPDRVTRTPLNDGQLELRDAPGPPAVPREPHLEDLD